MSVSPSSPSFLTQDCECICFLSHSLSGLKLVCVKTGKLCPFCVELAISGFSLLQRQRWRWKARWRLRQNPSERHLFIGNVHHWFAANIQHVCFWIVYICWKQCSNRDTRSLNIFSLWWKNCHWGLGEIHNDPKREWASHIFCWVLMAQWHTMKARTRLKFF